MKRLYLYLTIALLARTAQAGLITHSDYTSGNTITAAGQNANENLIFNEFNGNIDNTNIKSGGILTANIAAANITTTLMAPAVAVASMTITTGTIINQIGTINPVTASVGNIGEIIRSSVPSTTQAITSGNAVSIGTATLTAGCWGIQTVSCFESSNASTTLDKMLVSINTTANTIFSQSSASPQDNSGRTGLSQNLSGYILGAGGSYCLNSFVTHVCIASTTPYYGICQANFGVSAYCNGGIQAIRER